MRNYKIDLREGYAIDIAREDSIDAIVNSANNGLLLGTSGAGRIREVTKRVENEEELKEFYRLCDELGNIGKGCLRWMENFGDSEPSYVQLECLRILKKIGGRAEIGNAYLTPSGLEKPKYIIHAVGMGYEWKPDTKGERIKATHESIRSALERTFDLANELEEVESLALPLMCVRPKYGIPVEDCYQITIEVIEEKHGKLDRIVICADNDFSKEFLRKLKS